MGHKSINPAFFLENWQSAESWYRWNNILIVYSTGFLQFTCQNITHLSMPSHRAFMIYKLYTYHRCEKTVAQDAFYTKTYKHR